jgi:hypothetical protein
MKRVRRTGAEEQLHDTKTLGFVLGAFSLFMFLTLTYVGGWLGGLLSSPLLLVAVYCLFRVGTGGQSTLEKFRLLEAKLKALPRPDSFDDEIWTIEATIEPNSPHLDAVRYELNNGILTKIDRTGIRSPVDLRDARAYRLWRTGYLRDGYPKLELFDETGASLVCVYATAREIPFLIQWAKRRLARNPIIWT